MVSVVFLVALQVTPELTQHVNAGLKAKSAGDLETAIRAPLNSRFGRRRAQAGIETGFADGMNVIRHLDVIVANVMRDDRISLAAWRGARHIESVGRGLHRTVKPQAPDSETTGGAPALSAVTRAGYAS